VADRRQPLRPPADPFPRHHGGAQIQYKDYTKFVQWTPRKIALFSLCLVIPYIAAAIAVGIATSPFVGILMLAIPGILIAIGGFLYWVARSAF
jgi:hypothetical protein